MDINDLVLNDDALAIVDGGTWMPAGDKAPGVEFLVTGMRSQGARKMIKSLQAKMRAQARGKELTEDDFTQITKEVLIEAVLQDWRGLKSKGEDLPYSKELAREIIMSRGGETFTTMVLHAAQALDETANSFVENVTKNS